MIRKKTKSSKKGSSLEGVKKAAESVIDLIEKSWPQEVSPELAGALENLRSAVGNLSQETTVGGLKWPSEAAPGPERFDVLGVLRRVLSAMDMLFLSRQITYHVAASAELQKVFADIERVKFILAKILEHIVRRAQRLSRIEIGIKDYSFRGNPGMEIAFSSEDKCFGELDRQKFLADIFQGKTDEMSGIALAECRSALLREQGQLWVDVSKSKRVVYHAVLPVSEKPKTAGDPAQQTFRYDISISNYADVRRRFGVRKSASLVGQIEQYVKSLVRYPVDMVMSIGEKGMITTIYETPQGSAQSVASRISERLGHETFHIGRKSVDISFSYHLSPLASHSGPK